MTAAAPILDVAGLRTDLATEDGLLTAVNDVSFKVAAGEIVGIAGESGSGKSMTAFSIMGLLEPPAKISAGSVGFRGQNLVAMDEKALRRIRGRHIAMIFQDPMMTLNPVLTIGTQITETIFAHESVSRSRARKRAVEALSDVGVSAPEERLRQYPHQLSGGMRQRVAIAIAMVMGPDLLIADEPTTALDVTIQGQILAEVQHLCRQRGAAIIWITHDLGVLSETADRILVMYGGRLVEMGTTDDVLDRTAHPYTKGLLDSLPKGRSPSETLTPIPGTPRALSDLLPGCAFYSRCSLADAACLDLPSLTPVGGSHYARCVRPLVESTAS